jgi:hypothetical protein
MSALDEADAVMAEAIRSSSLGTSEIVAAIVAAGYSKPRTIATVDELDALPVGAVIIDRDGDAWQRERRGWTCTDRALNTSEQPSGALVHVLGPATVLYSPEES